MNDSVSSEKLSSGRLFTYIGVLQMDTEGVLQLLNFRRNFFV